MLGWLELVALVGLGLLLARFRCVLLRRRGRVGRFRG